MLIYPAGLQVYILVWVLIYIVSSEGSGESAHKCVLV